MAEVASQEGAQNATVARIVALSGISRRTFYDLFEDREACFLAAFEDALARAGDRALAAYGSQGRWQARVRAGLLAVLEFFQEEPDMGRLLVVESLRAGPRVLARREQLVELLAMVVSEGERPAGSRATAVADGGVASRVRGHGGASSGGTLGAVSSGVGGRGGVSPGVGAEGVVGAVLSVIQTRLQRGETQALTQLMNPLMAIVVLPYLGPAAARRESERPAPPPPSRSTPRRGDPLRGLDMRLTYRTVRVLTAVAETPGASNRQVAASAGVADQGQISKLLLRLANLGLIENTGAGPQRGEPNAWTLTQRGEEVERTIHERTAPGD